MSDTVNISLCAITPPTSGPTDLPLDITLGTDVVVTYDGDVLPSEESLLILVPEGRTFRLVATDFGIWTVSASPRISNTALAWERIGAEGKAVDVGTHEWPHTGFLEVTIELQAAGQQTKTKKIHIKIQPETCMPGTDGF